MKKNDIRRISRRAIFIVMILYFCGLFFSCILHADTGTASWYDSASACKFNKNPKCPTASGRSIYELEKNKIDFAASWRFPIHSTVKVCNRDNGKCTQVVILDRGPAKRLNRIIDLSKMAFQKIGALEKGVITVEVIK